MYLEYDEVLLMSMRNLSEIEHSSTFSIISKSFSDKQINVDSLKDMNMVMLPFFIYVFVLGMLYLPA